MLVGLAILETQQRLDEPESQPRIEQEIVVDAYGGEEQAIGWYCYLEDKLHFPFAAKCITQRSISPLRKDEPVQVLALALAEECDREMFVSVKWQNLTLAVTLMQLEPTGAVLVQQLPHALL